MAWPWNLGLGLFKVIENVAVRQTMYDFLLVCHCNYSSTLYRLRVIDVEYYRGLDMWVKGHWRSLKLVQFESLNAVFYSPSIVTMAVSVVVCEIFSIKEWCYLENMVRVRSRSLEMAPFDRSHTSSYSPSIATIWRYLVSFDRYSDLLVENREIFIPHLYLSPPQGMTLMLMRNRLFYGLMLIGSFVNLTCHRAKPTMPGCQRIPQRRHVELVANSETGNTGLKKARVCMPYRGLCLMRCAPLEIVVLRQ